MSDPDYARVLLNMAEKDLGALRGMADSAVFVDEVFGVEHDGGAVLVG